MVDYNTEKLKKYFECPALADFDDILEAKLFLKKYKEMQDMYRSIFAEDPIGDSIEFMINNADSYLSRIQK